MTRAGLALPKSISTALTPPSTSMQGQVTVELNVGNTTKRSNIAQSQVQDVCCKSLPFSETILGGAGKGCGYSSMHYALWQSGDLLRRVDGYLQLALEMGKKRQ